MKRNIFTKFMASPAGSHLKHFLAIMVAQWLIELQNGHELFTFNVELLQKLVTAAVVSSLPVIINWLNPDYKNYGK